MGRSLVADGDRLITEEIRDGGGREMERKGSRSRENDNKAVQQNNN